jgi:hypothetical protein
MIEELITLVERRRAHLTQLKASAEMLGDLNSLTHLEEQIAETEATLAKLRSLPGE